MQLHPFPEPDAPELEQYLLHLPGEIAAILARIAAERTLVTAYTGREAEFAVSTILAVDTDFDEVLLEMPADPQARVRLLAARDLVFVIFFEAIKIQFRAPLAQATSIAGRPAVRVRMPRQMLRLQRREYFRVSTPLTAPARCLVPAAPGASKYESLQVINISLGGLAILSYPHLFELPAAETVRDCVLDLPGLGTIHVALRLVNTYGDAGAAERRQCGCQFVELTPQARLLLQRYVNRVEALQGQSAAD